MRVLAFALLYAVAAVDEEMEEDMLEDDFDEDGEVTKEELMEYMDADKDGKVTFKEAWEAVAREVEEFSNEEGEPLTPEPPAHIKEVIDKADANGNSLIDMDEMLPFVEHLTAVVDLDEEDDDEFDEEEVEA